VALILSSPEMTRLGSARLPPVDVLHDMYVTRQVKGRDGAARRLHSEIHPRHSWALYQAVLKYAPHTVVEIGMAHGASTLSILAALAELGRGKLISIDPEQSRDFSGAGVENVRRAGFSDMHTLIEAPSFAALPELLKSGAVVDFAYIDGWHTFDYALVDFFYLDKLMPAGGVVGFNDCGHASVRKALGYVRTHRRYDEINVGLKRDMKGRTALHTAVRLLLGLRREDRYFRKRESWEPPWNFFRNF